MLAVSAALVLGACRPLPPGIGANCELVWGSTPERAGHYSAATVQGVRAGQHDCFDRMVVDLSPGAAPGYWVEYEERIREPGRGEVVPLDGRRNLRVIVNAPAYDPMRNPTYEPVDPEALADVRGFRTFRQVAMVNSFEGRTTFGLGVRARLPFRVFTIDGPGDATRLVVDVAHRW